MTKNDEPSTWSTTPGGESYRKINPENTNNSNANTTTAPPTNYSANAKWFIQNFLTAGLASSIAVTVLAPVERAKLILQVQKIFPAHSKDLCMVPYRGLGDVLRRTVRDEGVIALWRGNVPSVIRCFFYQALNFSFKESYNVLFSRLFDTKSIKGQVIPSLLAGGFAGCTTLSIVYPLDYSRTRMAVAQLVDKNSEARTLKGNFVGTIRTKGYSGLYAGYWISCVGVFIYRSMYFGLYDTEKFLTPKSHQNLLISFIEAEVAATMAGLISYPVDTVRRSMMSNTIKEPVMFANSYQCIKSIFVQQGFKGFYRGAVVNILRSTGGAMVLVLYDVLKDQLWGTGNTKHKKPSPTDEYCKLFQTRKRKKPTPPAVGPSVTTLPTSAPPTPPPAEILPKPMWPQNARQNFTMSDELAEHLKHKQEIKYKKKFSIDRRKTGTGIF